MWVEQEMYVAAKLLEIEAQRKHASLRVKYALELGARSRPRPLAPIVRAGGRRVRRLGEALERWASTEAPLDAVTRSR
jgi:hypothetical protein